jgi:hypothetical protein
MELANCDAVWFKDTGVSNVSDLMFMAESTIPRIQSRMIGSMTPIDRVTFNHEGFS